MDEFDKTQSIDYDNLEKQAQMYSQLVMDMGRNFTIATGIPAE